MPAADLTVLESNNTVQRSAGNTICVIGADSAYATPVAVDPSTSLLGSKNALQDLAGKIARVSKKRCYLVGAASSISGTIGAVTETPAGTGPLITATGTARDTHDFAVKITKAGPMGTARFRVSYDATNPTGATYGPEIETAATYAIPNTNIVLGFPAVGDPYGDANYVLDTIYTFSTVQVGGSSSEYTTAMQTMADAGLDYSLFAIDASHITVAADLKTFCDAIDAKLTTILAQKEFVRALVSGATTIADADIKTAFANFVSSRVVVCPRGSWTKGVLYDGSPRRPGLWDAAARAAKARFSSDLGNGQDGPLDEISALTADEYSTATKLRDSRFTVMESRPGLIGFYFSRGLTMAAPTSRYKHFNLSRVMDAGCRQAQADLNTYVNNDFIINPNGTIAETEAKAIEMGMKGNLKSVLLDPKPAHASAVDVSVNREDVLANTEDLKVGIQLTQKGQAVTVSATIGYKSVFIPE